MAKHVVNWDRSARDCLKQVLQYIRMDSPQNAQKIKAEVRTLVNSLPEHPFRFPKDKFRIANSGEYRALIVYSLRISYYIGAEEIRIVRVRHTKQGPLFY